MKRLYQSVINHHFAENRQMLFLTGPRQVGKTTTSLLAREDWDAVFYFSWDNPTEREIIAAGPNAVADAIDLEGLGVETVPVVIFDEIHKWSKWKDFLKGLYDSFPFRMHILVTGSALLNFFKKGGDSLMGRYFSYRLHPLTVGEVVNTDLRDQEIVSPKPIGDEDFEALLQFGGFPDPFLKREERHYNKWKRARADQLFREDLRDLSLIHDQDRVEILAELVRQRSGQLLVFNSLARWLGASAHSVRRWLDTLSALYYCFPIRPWTKNVSRSLIKEPKYYLHDWSLCENAGARAENFVASHLLKAVNYWTDEGFGDYGLYFLRTRDQKEVDFVVTKDKNPWFLVEVKNHTKKGIAPALIHFHEELKTEHAFQVILDLPYADSNCFDVNRPIRVSARTLLSQLL